MTSTPTAVRIRTICIGIDPARTTLTRVFSVVMPFISQYGLETDVYDLLEKVKAAVSPSVSFSIADATVWKLKYPKPLRPFGTETRSQTQKDGNEIKQYIRNLNFSSQAGELDLQDKIKDLFEPKSIRELNLHIIIQVPGRVNTLSILRILYRLTICTDQNKRQREIANDIGDDQPPTKITVLNRSYRAIVHPGYIY